MSKTMRKKTSKNKNLNVMNCRAVDQWVNDPVFILKRSIAVISILIITFMSGLSNAQELSSGEARAGGWIITWMSGEAFIKVNSDSLWDTLGTERVIRTGNIIKTGSSGRMVLKGNGLFIKMAESTTIIQERSDVITVAGGSAWFYSRARTNIKMQGRGAVMEEASAVVEVDHDVISSISVMEGFVSIENKWKIGEGERARLVKGRTDPSVTAFVPRHVLSKWEDFVGDAIDDTMSINQHGVQVISTGLAPGIGSEAIPGEPVPDVTQQQIIEGRVPPAVIIDNPETGASVGVEFRLRGRVPSPGVNGVEIYLNNKWLRSVPLTSGWYDTIIDLDRSHAPLTLLEVRATDAAGVTGAMRRELKVDIYPPVVTLVPVIANGSHNQRIRGFVDDPTVSEVSVYINRYSRDERKYHAPVFAFSFEIQITLRDGVNIITVEAVDAVGNKGVEKKSLRYSPGAFNTIYNF